MNANHIAVTPFYPLITQHNKQDWCGLMRIDAKHWPVTTMQFLHLVFVCVSLSSWNALKCIPFGDNTVATHHYDYHHTNKSALSSSLPRHKYTCVFCIFLPFASGVLVVIKFRHFEEITNCPILPL